MTQLCDATTVAGEPCKRNAMEGFTKCVSHMGRVGRPTLLTEELSNRLTTMLRSGAYLQVAIKAIGVDYSTYKRWMTRGRSGKAEDVEYRIFREAVERSQAEAEVLLVGEITRAARDSWQAASWLLERLAPTRYGKPSVRMRAEAPPPQPVEESPDDDPFTEVDELAERRRGYHG